MKLPGHLVKYVINLNKVKLRKLRDARWWAMCFKLLGLAHMLLPVDSVFVTVKRKMVV